MMRRTLLGLLLLGLLLHGCAATEGEPCRIDSDCDPGLICGFDGVCRTPEGIVLAFEAEKNAKKTVCPSAGSAWVATSVVIRKSSTGLGAIADLANPVIVQGFDQIDLVLVREGEGGKCPGNCAWLTSSDGECAEPFREVFPLRIPAPIGVGLVLLDDYVFDQVSGVLTGTVTRAVLLEQINPTLRDSADQILKEDVDSDGDEVPDRMSVVLDIGFEPASDAAR